MNRLSINNALYSVLVCSVYAAIVLYLRHINLWAEHYSGGGALYIVNSVLKFVYFVFNCFIIHSIGKIFLGVRRDLSNLKTVCVTILSGAALVTIAMHLLGIVGALFFYMVFPVCLLVLLVYGYTISKTIAEIFIAISKAWCGRQHSAPFVLSWVVGLLAGAAFLYLAMARGLYPDALGNDSVGHYMPYFRDAIQRGYISPAPNYIDYFICKGAGLYFFFAVLTDVQSLQLASLFAVMLICFILADVIIDASEGCSSLALAFVFVFLSFVSLYQLEFQKQHCLAGAFLIGQWYLLVRSAGEKVRSGSPLILSLLAVTLALSILSTVSVVISLPTIAWAMWVGGRRDTTRRRVFLVVAALQLLTVLVIFIGNEMVYGLADMNPVHFFFKFRDEFRISRYIDPHAIDFHLMLVSHDSYVANSIEFLAKRLQSVNPMRYLWSQSLPPFWLMLILAIPGILMRRRDMNHPIVLSLCPAGSLLVLSIGYVLNVVVKQESFAFNRFGFFLTFHMTILCAVLTIYTCRTIDKFISTWIPGRLVWGGMAIAFCLYSIVLFPHNWGDDMRETFEFLTGKANYEQRYSRVNLEIPACLSFMQYAQGDRKILALNLVSGCYGLPGSTFSPFLYDACATEFTSLCCADESEQRRIFEKHDLTLFYIDLGAPPLFYIYLPLFSSESISRNFKIVARFGESVYLLALGEPSLGKDMAAFLTSYQDYLGNHRDSLDARTLSLFWGKYCPDSALAAFR